MAKMAMAPPMDPMAIVPPGGARHLPSAGGSARSGASPSSSCEEMQSCVEVVLRIVLLHMGEFQPRAVANSLWAAAKLAVSPSLGEAASPSLGEMASSSLGDRHLNRGEEYSPLHGDQLPLMGGAPHYLLGEVAPHHPIREACRRVAAALLSTVPDAVPHFEPQHISNVLYALASLQPLPIPSDEMQRRIPALLDALLAHSWPLLHEFEAQALSNTLYSLAVLGHEPDEGER